MSNDLFLDEKSGKPLNGLCKIYYFSEENVFEVIGVKSRANYKNGKLHGVSEKFTIKGHFKNGTVHRDGLLIKEIWNCDYLTVRKKNLLIYRRNRTIPFTGELREYFYDPEKLRLEHLTLPFGLRHCSISSPSNYIYSSITNDFNEFESMSIYRAFCVVDGRLEGSVWWDCDGSKEHK